MFFDNGITDHEAIDKIKSCLAEVMQNHFDNGVIRHINVFVPNDTEQFLPNQRALNFIRFGENISGFWRERARA